jgi:energy-coupling factor transporter transmembrane protein EcfT
MDKKEQTMNKAIKRVVYWTPRILCILFAVFISLFALDVFEGGRGFWETSVALLLHLVPTIIIVAVLVVSWRREWIGGILFTALGIFYVAWAWGRFHRVYAIISGPLLLIGILFLLSWRHRAVLHAKA